MDKYQQEAFGELIMKRLQEEAMAPTFSAHKSMALGVLLGIQDMLEVIGYRYQLNEDGSVALLKIGGKE